MLKAKGLAKDYDGEGLDRSGKLALAEYIKIFENLLGLKKVKLRGS